MSEFEVYELWILIFKVSGSTGHVSLLPYHSICHQDCYFLRKIICKLKILWIFVLIWFQFCWCGIYRVTVDNTSNKKATLIKVWMCFVFVKDDFLFIFWNGLNRFYFFTLNSKNLAYKMVGTLQVDSANKRGSLLQVVQVLSDFNLIVKRAYISSDGEWFMDGEFLNLFRSIPFISLQKRRRLN